MNILEQFLKNCEFRITEGSEYSWNCFGHDAYCLDSWNGHQDGHSFTVTFDKKTQEVYELQAHDYANNRAYRWFNPDYRDSYFKEANTRNSDPMEAWDDLNYTELDVLEDFFEKMQAIYAEVDYDTRIKVPVDFTDEELLTYMKIAHERDITFNQLVEEALKAAIDEAKSDPEGFKSRADKWKARM